MLSDGLNAAIQDGKATDAVEVVDVAQMLLAAVRRSDGDGGSAETRTPEPQPDPEPAPVA
jgi:hypothetical protein